MECKKCKDVDIILSHGCLYFKIILMDQFMFLHVGYGSIIFPKRLLHFTFFSSRFYFNEDNLHAKCCCATLSVWMCKFIVLQHFRREIKLCACLTTWIIEYDFFWLLSHNQIAYILFTFFFCASLETTQLHLKFYFLMVPILHNLLVRLYNNHFQVV